MGRQLKENMFTDPDFLEQYRGTTLNPPQNSMSAAGLPDFLASSLSGGLGLGLNNLFDIIRNQGRTDPLVLNRQRASNFRNAAAQRTAFEGRAAQRGMQRSGVNAALSEALEGAGLDRDAAIVAQDRAQAQKRQFDAINLLMSMLASESRNQAFLGEGAANRKVAKDAAFDQFLANLLGGVAVPLLKPLIGSNEEGDDEEEVTPPAEEIFPGGLA